jgi:hypothetical protein
MYAVERKLDSKCIGTVALVKEDGDDDIGDRFLKEYWGEDMKQKPAKDLSSIAKSNILKS